MLQFFQKTVNLMHVALQSGQQGVVIQTFKVCGNQGGGHTLFLALTAVIVAAGIKGGIEKFSKVMMPLLFVIAWPSMMFSS